MIDAMTLFTAAVCAAMCLRLVAFRRNNSRYRLGISLMAWILSAATGCQAIASVLGLYQVQSPFVLIILSALCALVFRSRGNVAQILRVD
ncbi:phage holin family protein [Pseudomonas arsenicoxydans]|uniref:Phage holin family protein n=1 Tax=Pseudomonas arsenicoxydans TaxID=702115 RepID=A0A502HSY8_9PSED|nr:phage holin family protein [Pseudomonas arsenicoxydans]